MNVFWSIFLLGELLDLLHCCFPSLLPSVAPFVLASFASEELFLLIVVIVVFLAMWVVTEVFVAVVFAVVFAWNVLAVVVTYLAFIVINSL